MHTAISNHPRERKRGGTYEKLDLNFAAGPQTRGAIKYRRARPKLRIPKRKSPPLSFPKREKHSRVPPHIRYFCFLGSFSSLRSGKTREGGKGTYFVISDAGGETAYSLPYKETGWTDEAWKTIPWRWAKLIWLFSAAAGKAAWEK